MSREMLRRLLAIAASLGELRLPRASTEKICDRLVALAGTLDRAELDALAEELTEILEDAAQEQLARGPTH
jgi:hypothetical protein